jgi:ubiquinone/menaquinone biosynthesis C-methylase UbiE
MRDNLQEPPKGTLSQQMFGSRAPVYATSQVHVSDDSLELIKSFIAPGTYGWAVDLGTGAGFTAFAMAEFSRRVLATDPTLPMLQQSRRMGQERQLGNLMVCQNAAEALPFANNSLDLVTSRVAAHHFANFGQALEEIQRVLKAGGVLVMADSVAPEDDAVAEWMNDVELRRDFSHVKDRQVAEIEAMLAERGLDIVQQEYARIYLQFNDWVARTATPQEEITTLREDFLSASPSAREAFQIQAVGDDIHFSWPCLVFQALRR